MSQTTQGVLVGYFLLKCCLVVAAGCGSSDEPTDPWQTIQLGTDAQFRDIHFLDKDNGWMVGAAGIAVPGGIVARTHDGGLTWEYTTGVIPARSRTHTVDFNTVHFVDAMRGVAGAGAGTIMRTEDGGATWKTSKTVFGEELMAIEVRDGRVWVAGDRVREEPQRLFRLVFEEPAEELFEGLEGIGEDDYSGSRRPAMVHSLVD